MYEVGRDSSRGYCLHFLISSARSSALPLTAPVLFRPNLCAAYVGVGIQYSEKPMLGADNIPAVAVAFPTTNTGTSFRTSSSPAHTKSY